MIVFFWVSVGAVAVLALVWVRVRYSGFIAQNPQDYSSKGIDFDLRTHLKGPIICEGVIFGPFGRVTSRFVGDFDCIWQDDHGVMREKFTYDDGSIQNREWTLVIDDGGVIKATAPDVIGIATGVQNGPSLQLKYRIQMPENAGSHVLDTVDWMYLTPNGNIVNRSQFRKFGIKVAELVATMRPVNSTLKEDV